MYRNTFISVSRDAVRTNVRNAVKYVGSEKKLLAVVKSDAYGHGALEVAKAAIEAGAEFLAVALAEEALPLRHAGIDVPILVLGVSNDKQLSLACELNLDVCIAGEDDLLKASRAAENAGQSLRIHLKTDTGMGRIGFRTLNEFEKALGIIKKSHFLSFIGLFSHLACADTLDKEFSQKQKCRFEQFRQLALSNGFNPICHLANSAAIMNDDRSFHYDMVRFGISLYGYYASDCVSRDNIDIEPVMSLFSEIVHIKKIAAGESVSYGATYVADSERIIATVPIGYGDGYNRLLSNKGRMIVLVEGKSYFAPIVGRVCMDQTMIDVTDIPGVGVGSEIIVLGRSGDKKIDADEMADICGTISYEILLSFTARVPRIYE